jgi:phosphatidylglycerophosphatase A
MRLLASLFGTGLLLRKVRSSDIGSGTVGAGVALAVALLLGPQRWGWQLLLAGAVTVTSIVVTAPFSRDGEDPGWVVIDEAAGALLATVGLSTAAAVVAWVGFRTADIFKRAFPGVAAAENLRGGWGVTADDIVAGGYGLAAGWLFELLTR